MKAIFPLVLLLGISAVTAQEPEKFAPAAPAQAKLLPHQQAFLNLPEEKRKEFIALFQEANKLFQEKRIFETLDRLAKAEKIFQDSPEIKNLQGSCYVEIRAFDKALAHFNEAMKISGKTPTLAFNISEVHFVTKDYRKALEGFEEVLRMLPPNNIGMGRIVEFKILICKNKLGMNDDVKILAGKYDYLDDSPFHYYAQAVLAYDAGNDVEAEQSIGRATRIFQDPALLSAWQDTMIESGYVKSFYGEEETTVPSAPATGPLVK